MRGFAALLVGYVFMTLLTFFFYVLFIENTHGHLSSAVSQGEAYGNCMQHIYGSLNCYPATNGDYYECRSEPPGTICGYPHYTFSWTESCASQPTGTGFFSSQEPSSWCDNGCLYEATTGTCNADGTQCMFNVSPSGDACSSGGNLPDQPPENCTTDAFGFAICDCSVTPDDPWCISPPGDPPPEGCIMVGDVVTCTDTTGDPPSNDDPPPGTSNDPGDLPPQDSGGDDPENPPGDGDPDTPDTPGSGDGDVDEDGERDIDCDPFSNPDCEFKGSAAGSGSCDVQPSCFRVDPGLCAILYQEWASMCYGERNTVDGAGDCSAAFTCQGDKILCEFVRQERDNHCATFGNDNGASYDPRGDSDFDRDLKTEANDTDVSNMIDTEGFAGVGSCPADQSVDIGIGVVNVPFTYFCSLADTLKPLLIMLAMFTGYMIIGGKR